VNSSKNSWGQRNRTRVEFDKEHDTPGPTTLMAAALRRPVTPDSADAIRLGAGDGRPEAPAPGVTQRSRIAVIGDSDFATNSFFHIMGNGTLFLSTVSYLAGQENLIGLQPRTHDLPRVNLTNRQMKGMFFLSVLLVPGLLGFVGTAVWWRQR